MKKPAVKLMPDNGCFPLWHAGGTGVGNIDPAELGLSESLVHDLHAWAQVYESHLDFSDPASCSWTETEEEDFDRVGLSLWHRIVSEIGDRVSVQYQGIRIKKNEA
jgi:hypothetical protein